MRNYQNSRYQTDPAYREMRLRKAKEWREQNPEKFKQSQDKKNFPIERGMYAEKCIILAQLTEGRLQLKRAEILTYAQLLKVSTRTIRRYLDKVGRAQFMLKELQG